MELQCSADGDQPVTIKWFKDSTPIERVDPQRYSTTDAPSKEGTKSILTVSSADSKDDGIYLCVAENSFGKDERKIRVNIIEPPPTPSNFSVGQIWSRTVSVTWSKPLESKTSILNYLIRYWKVLSPGVNDRLNEVNISSSSNLHFIKDLEPGSHYVSTISAINEVGLGSQSAEISFTTGEEEPSGPPVDLVVASRGPTTALLSWRSPLISTWNGKLLGFYVGYRLFDDYKTSHSYRTVYIGESNSSHHDYFLSSLLKGTKYSVIVKAFNLAGTGPESEEVVVETLSGDVPNAPQLFVSATTVDSITLGYSLPIDSNKIQNLDLHFKEGDDPVWREMDFFVDNKDAGEYTLSALSPGTIYTIYLTASNENGLSDPSPIIKTRTARSLRDNFAIGSFLESTGTGQFGDYRNLVSILSIIIAATIIIIVIVFAFVYVRKAQIEAATKPNFEFALASQTGTLALNKSSPGHNFGTERRYVDQENTKPLMMHGTMTLDHPNQCPVSYSNLPTESRHSKLVDPTHIYDFPR